MKRLPLSPYEAYGSKASKLPSIMKKKNNNLTLIINKQLMGNEIHIKTLKCNQREGFINVINEKKNQLKYFYKN